ncbi:hypothetical protein [Haloferula sp. BvORR071]|uniref:hypothetical protein n=1 Tax=Haloferula sp. BvORR071 TaxID=1396141 RepID=UPI000550E1D0|nr:hypothetical protein [Haloferula sp. BvORR071]
MAVSAKVARILGEVETLNAAEREELMRVLDDVEIAGHPAWSAELRNRAREIDEGTVTMVSASEFSRQLDEELASS